MPIPPRPFPLVGAIAVVLDDDRALLARRGKSPDAGLWGFPGGHVEPGETALAAAVRELHEETGVVADPLGYLTNIDILRHDRDGNLAAHYLLAAVHCSYVSGTPVPADDVIGAAWVDFADIRSGSLPMSARVAEMTELAIRRRQALRARRADSRA